MKHVPVLLLVLALLVLGCSDSVLWEEGDDVDPDTTRIKSIELARETCNQLVLDVAYHNDGSLPGYLRLSPNVRIEGQQWPMHPKMKVGDHVMQLTNGFQDDVDPRPSA